MIISSNILSVREENEQKPNAKMNNEAIIVNKSENKSSPKISPSVSNKFESFFWAEFILLFNESVIDQFHSLNLNSVKPLSSETNELLSSAFTNSVRSTKSMT